MALPSGFAEVHWHSQVLQRRMAFLIYLPPGYPEWTARQYPALYLLHGSGHDIQSILRDVQPEAHVSLLGEALLVIPNGDQAWWLDSPMLPDSSYNRYLLELVEFVDRRYRTIADRVNRGICGFSMGGYGAMWTATQHPNAFGAASSLLGTLDIVQMYPLYYRLGQLLGQDLATWQQYNPTQWVARLSQTALQFCTAENAFDRAQNEIFAAALHSAGIPFEYAVYPGQHDVGFVREHIGAHFRFHRRIFDQGTEGQ